MEPASRPLVPESGRDLPTSRRRLGVLLALTRAIADAPGLVEASRKVMSALADAEGWSAGVIWVLLESGDPRSAASRLRCAEI